MTEMVDSYINLFSAVLAAKTSKIFRAARARGLSPPHDSISFFFLALAPRAQTHPPQKVNPSLLSSSGWRHHIARDREKRFCGTIGTFALAFCSDPGCISLVSEGLSPGDMRRRSAAIVLCMIDLMALCSI